VLQSPPAFPIIGAITSIIGAGDPGKSIDVMLNDQAEKASGVGRCRN